MNAGLKVHQWDEGYHFCESTGYQYSRIGPGESGFGSGRGSEGYGDGYHRGYGIGYPTILGVYMDNLALFLSLLVGD